MPPDMLRQLRSGGMGGMQEMMKAMMGGEDAPDMEEIQSKPVPLVWPSI
jgi:signal recognition particle subunit SRP54